MLTNNSLYPLLIASFLLGIFAEAGVEGRGGVSPQSPNPLLSTTNRPDIEGISPRSTGITAVEQADNID
jgi:hypothetical protein